MTIRGVRRVFALGMLFLSMLPITYVLAVDAPPPPPPLAPPPTETPDAPPPKAKKPEDVQGLTWNAVHMSLDQDKNALVLQGSAVVSYKGIKLEGDKIVLFRETKELYGEGNLRLRIGESEISAEIAYLDALNDTGYLVDAVVRVSGSKEDQKKLNALRKSKTTDEPEIDGTLPPEHESPTPTGSGSRGSTGVNRQDSGTGSFLRTRDPYGVYVDVADDPQARTNIILKAQKVVIHGREHLSAENAFITNDDMAHPMYGVVAGNIEFYMKDVPDPKKPGQTQLLPNRIIAKKATIQIYGVKLFPFPTVTYDFQRKSAYIEEHGGRSKRFGYFSLTRIGYGLGGDESRIIDPQHIYFDIDERMSRGPGGGMEMDWETGARPIEVDKSNVFDRGVGHFKVYGVDELQIDEFDDLVRARRDLQRRIEPKIDGRPLRKYDANLLFINRRTIDNAGPPDFTLDTYHGQARGLIQLSQHQPLKRFAGIDNLQLDFKFERDSDRDFKLEYFQNNYLKENQPEGLFSARKASDNYSMELLYRGNTQNFDGAPARSPVDYGTFTNYEPALTYSLVTTPLCYGLYMDTELQAGHLKRDFEKDIYHESSFESDRAYGKIDFSRPVKWGVVNFVPHLGGQQQYYDQLRTIDHGGEQGALTYGMDATSRFYGLFPDLRNDDIGLHGMRHILETRVSYSGISNTEENPVKLPDFDRIDDLVRKDTVTFAVDQVAQTKKLAEDGTVHTYNFAGLNMSIDYYPNTQDSRRLLDGYATDLFRVDGFFRISEALKLTMAEGLEIPTKKLHESVYGFDIDPHTRWKLRFEERFTYGSEKRAVVGSDQFRTQFSYQLSERWGFNFEQISERRQALQQRKGVQLEKIGFTRSYGALEGTFLYSFDRNNNDHSVYYTVHPAVVYRNVIVPSQDLLVPQAEVTSDGEEPEERNFDPFDLLKQRRKKNQKDLGPAKAHDNATPPPPPVRDNDVPTPPPPDQKRTSDSDAGKSDSAAGSFSDPRTRDSSATERKKPVDDDDWTATPASTR